MISLIICSKYPVINKELQSNISNTIGAEYEIVHIDNSNGDYNIFEAYNLGIEQSKGEYLCFMHEDVIFHSPNWGNIIQSHLSQPFVGALGVAGGCVVANQLDWRFYGFGHVYIRQGTQSIEETPHYYISHDIQKSYNPLLQVAVLDGVLMCIRKELFKNISFDSSNFNDFHLYDSDICMQINKLGYGVFLTQDIILEHQSEGVFSESYIDSLDIFINKWKDNLPLIRGKFITQAEIDESVQKALPFFEKRIAHDSLVISIRNKIKNKDSASAIQYTKAEQTLIDDSAFALRKRFIKDKSMSNAEVWECVKEYLNIPFVKKKKKLIIKFIWYRFCRWI